MTTGETVAARAIVRRADVLGRVRVTLIVSNAGDASESHELGPYDSRVRAQSVADVAVHILRRKAKEHGSFNGEEVRQAVLSAEGSTGGPQF
jgi:hypothetical protein